MQNLEKIIYFNKKENTMIDHDLKCIFIHIPRTAGSSLATAITQRKKTENDLNTLPVMQRNQRKFTLR